MSQFKLHKPDGESNSRYEEAFAKLQTLFDSERSAVILSILNEGEQRIVTECWDQLHHDLNKHQDPQNMSITTFMFHFHNYGS